MRTQIQNPFIDWKRQTFGYLAVNRMGIAVSPNSKDACAWCARGWIYRKFKNDNPLMAKILNRFNVFMIDEHQRPITQLNDVCKFTPRDFKVEFDKFMEKGGLLYGKKANGSG